MREVVKMASCINEMIQMTGDCPSLKNDGRMPLLNTKVWVEGELLLYENYRKPMANPLIRGLYSSLYQYIHIDKILQF